MIRQATGDRRPGALAAMKTDSSAATSYSSRFREPAEVAFYERGEYGPDSYASFIWQLQKPFLEKAVEEFRRKRPGPIHLLDFACGTGRIVSCLEPLVDVAEGVDLSEQMIEVARKKCLKARLQVGDIVANPGLLREKYEVITCFRFILNVEPEIRSGALQRLRGVIREPHGLLFANVHGNSRSSRHPAILWKKWRARHAAAGGAGVLLNEMSPAQAKQLLWDNGFQIIQQMGFGVMPRTAYRTPLRVVAAAIDRFFARRQWCKNGSVDLLFVCQPRVDYDAHRR